MRKYEIVFQLNTFEKIVIELEEPLSVVNCCSQAQIVLYFENKNYNVREDSIRYYIDLFRTLLTKVINNEFQLHESIIEDIGYLGNESFQNKPYLIYESCSDGEWVGEKHSLWGGPGFATWLYNDIDKNIIFEITPFYKYHFSDSENALDYVPYEQWIKEYKPYLIKKIPREVAEQWLAQANNLLTIIDENTERERLAYEATHLEK